MSVVWLTGLGTISPLGTSLESLWSACRSNQSGIVEGLGRVPKYAPQYTNNRALDFSLISAREALAQAQWNSLGQETGLIVATTTGYFLEWHSSLISNYSGSESLEDFRTKFSNQPLGKLTEELAQQLGVGGPTMLLTSACSAATQAIALAALWISQGRVKKCLVVGVEVLCDLTMDGFKSLQLLSPQTARPFDQNRTGINLSEGAGALCLEACESSHPNGLAAVSGFGVTTDAFHMTGPAPGGDGSRRAMERALRGANLAPKDIAWIHAHGTGSMANDLSEGQAIASLFGESRPWVSSTKWIHGHALAASGAIETALVVKAMSENLLLHTRGLENPDPAIQLNHPGQDLELSKGHVLKNTLGFGGTNASLILSHRKSVAQ